MSKKPSERIKAIKREIENKYIKHNILFNAINTGLQAVIIYLDEIYEEKEK